MDCSTPGFPVHHQLSNSYPSSQWCHQTISSSVVHFSCPQSFPALGSFPMSQLSISGGQSTGASASASVLPMNIQDWFPLGLTDLISLQSKGLSRVFSDTTVQKHQLFGAQLSLSSNSHIHTWLLEKPSFWLVWPLTVLKRWFCYNIWIKTQVKHTMYWENQTNKSCLDSHHCVPWASSHHFQGTRESKWDTIH